MSLTLSVAINKRDFRGHYGLGQAYEILKMPLMGMYFYKNAHTLRYDCGMVLLWLFQDHPVDPTMAGF